MNEPVNELPNWTLNDLKDLAKEKGILVTGKNKKAFVKALKEKMDYQ